MLRLMHDDPTSKLQRASSRVGIRAMTVEELQADLNSREALALATGMRVAPDWPPMHWDTGVVRWIIDKLRESPEEPLWKPWLVHLIERGCGGGPLVSTIVGTVGCKGPPVDEGVVEIGYSVVTSCWRQGIASEAAGLLISWLRETGRAQRVRAHTLRGDPASGGVLRRNGFELVGQVIEGDDGEVDRWELRLDR